VRKTAPYIQVWHIIKKGSQFYCDWVTRAEVRVAVLACHTSALMAQPK